MFYIWPRPVLLLLLPVLFTGQIQIKNKILEEFVTENRLGLNMYFYFYFILLRSS